MSPAARGVGVVEGWLGGGVEGRGGPGVEDLGLLFLVLDLGVVAEATKTEDCVETGSLSVLRSERSAARTASTRVRGLSRADLPGYFSR